VEGGVCVTFLAAARICTFDGAIRINLLPAVLKHGGNPNVVCTKHHVTPLFAAANPNGIPGSGSRYIYDTDGGVLWASPFNVGLLIDAGADIEQRNKQGNTPLVVAAVGENYDIVLMLLEAGAEYEGKGIVKYLRQSKQKNPKISTKESIDPYYNKVVDFLKAKGKIPQNVFDALTAPPPKDAEAAAKDSDNFYARRPFDPYADEWIQKRKEKKEKK
jgi:hypothetical protein